MGREVLTGIRGSQLARACADVEAALEARMPRNIEIKARVADLEPLRAVVQALGARPLATEEQTDRYYELDGARRVKLRTIAGGRAEMIHYRRPEDEGVRASDYEVTSVRDDQAGACLVPKGEPLVVVRKRREIWLLDNVRVHLDTVEGLGRFLELEAVVDAEHDDAVCRGQVDRILAALEVSPGQLVRASYSDLLRG
jgi:predicted adenylyl cyclase CyaB